MVLAAVHGKIATAHDLGWLEKLSLLLYLLSPPRTQFEGEDGGG